MPWLRVDDGFTRNRKVFDLTHNAFRLHVVGLCHCAANLTDGIVEVSVLPMLLAEAHVVKRYVNELQKARLWLGKGPWEIKDYLDYNPSREQVLKERKLAAERQRRKRESEGHGGSHGVTEGVSNGVSHASPAQPVPSQVTTTAVLRDVSAAMESPKGPIDRLMVALTDADARTRNVITALGLSLGLSEGDYEYARECAMGRSVRSPTRVAVDALKKRGREKVAS